MTSCVSSWKHIKLSSLLNFFVFIRNRRGRGTPRKPGSTAASASRRRSRTRWRRDCSPPRPRGSSGRSTRTRPGPAQHHSGGRQKSNLDCCGKLFFLCYNFLPVPFFTPPPPPSSVLFSVVRAFVKHKDGPNRNKLIWWPKDSGWETLAAVWSYCSMFFCHPIVLWNPWLFFFYEST